MTSGCLESHGVVLFLCSHRIIGAEVLQASEVIITLLPLEVPRAQKRGHALGFRQLQFVVPFSCSL